MNKYIIRPVSICFLLLLNYLNASGTFFDISLSTDNNRLYVNTDTDYSIVGYQVTITNISLEDCIDESGSGFNVAAANDIVLGFSLSGVTIPAGENTILSCLIGTNQANQEGVGNCLGEIIITTNDGTAAIPDSEIQIGDCLYLDCFNELGGSASVDDCGSCSGGSTGLEINYLEDCLGECNGNAVFDCSGICDGGAEIDGCGECVGGNTGFIACSNDCSGNIGGSATYNECGTCICNGETAQNGYTCVNSESECILGCDGNWQNDGTHVLNDECGVCGGDDSTCLDCLGVPNGLATLDCLGACGDPNSEDFAVEDLCGNCLGSCLSAPIIDCECDLSVDGNLACTGDCNPGSYTDPCFIWNSETWVDAPGGTLLFDEGEELNDFNNNGLLDIGCYDCGGNISGDDNYDPGNTFKPRCINNVTEFYCSALIDNNGISTATHYEDGSCLSNSYEELIHQFSLFPAYPNPFNPITTINYSVENAGNIKIDIYNVLGEHVYTLVDGYHAPGNFYQVTWNSESQTNIPVSSGVYFIKATNGNSVLIQELSLIK